MLLPMPRPRAIYTLQYLYSLSAPRLSRLAALVLQATRDPLETMERDSPGIAIVAYGFVLLRRAARPLIYSWTFSSVPASKIWHYLYQ